jgi:hypothetical protein
MSIISITQTSEDWENATPSIILINTSDPLSTVTTTGYLNGQSFNFKNTQMAIVVTTNGLASLAVSINGSNTSLIPLLT